MSPSTQIAPAVTSERFRITAAFVGLVVYLWVIHSYKAPIASYAIGLGLFGLVLQPYRVRFPAPLLWFGALVLWATLGLVFSSEPGATSEHVMDFAKLWLIFLVACNVAHSPRQLYILIIVWLGIFALYPVRGTFFNFMVGYQYSGRYAWNFIFANPNDLASLTLPMFAMSVALLQGHRERGWIRFSALAGVVMLPALIFMTQSRGGILALITMSLLILVQYRRQAKGFAVAVLVGGVIALVAPPEVWDRLGGLVKAGDTETLREVDAEGSAEQRFEIWKVARSIIADHPVTGVGLGMYPQNHARYASAGPFLPTARGERDTHSIYLNILAETGFPGLLLFLVIIGTILLQGRQVARSLALTDLTASRQVNTLLIGLIGFLQAGVFGSLQRVAFLWVYLGILATAIAVLAPHATERARIVPLRSRVGSQGATRTPQPTR